MTLTVPFEMHLPKIYTHTHTHTHPYRSVQNKAKNDREVMEKTFLNGEAGAHPPQHHTDADTETDRHTHTHASYTHSHTREEGRGTWMCAHLPCRRFIELISPSPLNPAVCLSLLDPLMHTPFPLVVIPPCLPTTHPGIYGPFDKFVPVLKKDGQYVLLAEDEYNRLKARNAE